MTLLLKPARIAQATGFCNIDSSVVRQLFLTSRAAIVVQRVTRLEGRQKLLKTKLQWQVKAYETQ